MNRDETSSIGSSERLGTVGHAIATAAPAHKKKDLSRAIMSNAVRLAKFNTTSSKINYARLISKVQSWNRNFRFA